MKELINKINVFNIEKEDLKNITIYFLMSRALVFVFMYLCYPNLQSQGITLWTLNDTEHYIAIAERWYYYDYEAAFFPFLPILIRFFGRIPIMILNNVLAYISTFIIYQLTKELFPEKSPMLMVKIWLYNPIAVFTCILYTESIFIFLTLIVYYLYKHQKHYILQGILLGLAVATRSPASLLFFTIFIFMMINVKNKKEKFPNVVKMYIPATIISCLYPIYLYFETGSFFMFAKVQTEVWNHVKSNIFTSIYYAIKLSFEYTGEYRWLNIADLAFFTFFLILLIYSIVKYRKNKNVYDLLLYAALTIIAVCSTSVNDTAIGVGAMVSYYRYLYGCLAFILLMPNSKKYYWIQKIPFFIVTCFFLLNHYFF